MTTAGTTTETIGTGERADLLATLANHRYFPRVTVRDLTDEQARLRTTASELCLGGLIKHVAQTESNWVDFILGGPDAIAHVAEELTAEGEPEDRLAEFRMQPGETLAGVLERYEEVARRTDEVVATLPDLDLSHPLPPAPWFEPGTRWSARRPLLHIIAETAQHGSRGHHPRVPGRRQDHGIGPDVSCRRAAGCVCGGGRSRRRSRRTSPSAPRRGR